LSEDVYYYLRYKSGFCFGFIISKSQLDIALIIPMLNASWLCSTHPHAVMTLLWH